MLVPAGTRCTADDDGMLYSELARQTRAARMVLLHWFMLIPTCNDVLRSQTVRQRTLQEFVIPHEAELNTGASAPKHPCMVLWRRRCAPATGFTAMQARLHDRAVLDALTLCMFKPVC